MISVIIPHLWYSYFMPRKEKIQNEEKLCYPCGEWKPFNKFNKSKVTSSGLHTRCKDCVKKFSASPQRKRYNKEYFEKNQVKITAYKRRWRQQLRLMAIEKLGRVCRMCGFDDMRALQIDHVNGRGILDRKERKRDEYYRLVVNDKTGKFQLLCANCNWIKRHENEEWKHYEREN